MSVPLDVQGVVRRAERAFRVAREGGFTGDQGTYALRVDPGGTARLSPRHLEVVEGGAAKTRSKPVTGAPLSVRTVAVSRGGRSLLGALEVSVREDGALSLSRGAVVEVLENDDGGMEQRWEWARAPEGEGDLEVRVAVEGLAYAGRTEHGHHFVDPVTKLGARYGLATWVDAAGRRTAVETVRDGEVLVMRVPTRVLEDSSWPAMLDPLVSPEIEVDVPVPVPNALSNTRAAVAFGGGRYLVAWENRIFTQDELFFARVDAADGRVLDVGSLVLAAGTGDQRSVAVASNGQDFLLAWEDAQVHPTTGPYSDLKGARVRGSDGRVLDGAWLNLSVAAGDERRPAIASDGTDYLVVWEDERRSNNTYDVYGTRVRASDGAILDVGGRMLAGGSGSTNHWLPQVGYARGNYLLTFTNGRLWGMRLRASDLGSLDGGGFVISSLAGIQASGKVAFDGNLFLVVWSDFRNGSSNPDVFGARVTLDGAVLDPSGLGISTAAQRQEAASVASNGNGFLVAWQHTVATNVTDLHAATVGSNGTVGSSFALGVAAASSDQERQPALASDGTRYFVAWHEVRSTSHILVSGARVEASGAMLDSEQVLSVDVSRELVPAVAHASGTYLVVWQDDRARAKVADILAVRVRASDGVVLDASPLLIATTASLEELPSVASDGHQFLVVFQRRTEGVSGSSDIFGVRVGADGAVLDATPIPISTAATDQTTPSVGFSGGYYLVAWTDLRVNPQRSDVFGARVRASDGVVMEPQGFAVSGQALQERRPVVASGNGQFFVAWEDERNFPYSGDIFGARVRASDGVVLDPQGIALATETYGEKSPTVAFDGNNYLVAWEDLRVVLTTVQGRRVRAADGVVVDPSALLLATEVVYQRQPTLGFDGTRYLLTWHRGSVNYSQHALHGRRFSPQMSPVDPSSFLITDTTSSGAGRIGVASSGPGRFLVAYNDYRQFARIRARLVTDPLENGAECSTAGQCSSGFCVDGVCCDGACGGGVEADCQACAVGAGGAEDGACGPVRAEVQTVCRPVSGPCDAAESCDGVEVECPADGFVAAGVECRPAARVCDAVEVCGGDSAECPEDVLEVDGTSCDDASACTREDSCQSGVCMGSDPVVCTVDDACQVPGTCDAATGTCSAPMNVPDGTACDDGNACTQVDACLGGRCAGAEPWVCSAPNPCMKPGTCDAATGQCSPPMPVDDGTACDDGNACTQVDSCQAGACTGASPVVCTAGDSCHVAGTCDAATGQCSPPVPVVDGTACDDGNACTQVDTCQTGVCAGANPVVCSSGDACLAAGTCDVATGRCSPPMPVVDGTACDDGNACTRSDTCRSGACTGSNPVVCVAGDACHTAGTCDASTGQCSPPVPAEDGSSCDDGNACTQLDTCRAGACTGANPVVCATGDACHTAGTCDGSTGQCSPPVPVVDGTSCDDGNACTRIDSCQAGACAGAAPVICGASDSCHEAGVCNPLTGSCSNPEREDGAECAGGSCQSGVCIPVPDAGSEDAGVPDAGGDEDAGTPDASSAPDAGDEDAGTPDASSEPDAGADDAGIGPDAGAPDSGADDAGATDAGGDTDAGIAPDAGHVDADGDGQTSGDAGTQDGGPGGPFVPAPEEPLGCGCGSSSDSSNLGLLTLLAGAVLLRASRRRHI
ncbi:hypothetical protein SAMN05443572_1011116 [Myxococcus fulvus]|uniref:Disintegrin domain-containing protein n=1 Tax=Myxococcus fulvus TaxID=33 RepID=A0ABY1BY66_MYXFU|nr:hypothetical protein [Myxococcus fulvus]SET10493.1 hypothetical protein SAMN05443572_1011116 [Myxococcus fulvus]